MALNPMKDTCSATSKSTRQRCQNPPVTGANVCRLHGGNAGQVRAASARRQRVAHLLQNRDVDTIPDNATLFREIIAEAAAVKDVWREMLSRDDDALTAQAAKHLPEALEKVARFIEMYEKLGIEERKIRVQEAQLVAIVDAVKAVLRDVGVDPDLPDVRASFRKHITSKLGQRG